MLSDHSLSSLSVSEVSLDLLGSMEMSMVSSAPLTASIRMGGALSLPVVASGAMVYSRPIGGSLPMSLELAGTPLLFRPLDGEVILEAFLSGTAAYSRPIGGSLVLPLTMAGTPKLSRPIGGILPMSVVGSGSLLTAIRMITDPGLSVSLNISLFSGFVEGSGIELDPITREAPEYPQLWIREPLQYVGVIDANDMLVEAELSGSTYYLGISWNEEMGEWTMSIRNLDEQLLVSGIPVVPLYPLLRQTRRVGYPPGELIVAISGGVNQDLDRQSFIEGKAVMFYVEPEDLASGSL